LNLILWILQGSLALLFLYCGAGKLNRNAGFWIELFAKMVRQNRNRAMVPLFAGSLEVVCAILLLIPGTSAIAAVLLAFTMGGAVVTHLFILHDAYGGFFPAFTLLLLVVVAWKRGRLRTITN
jgi:uncharacterized membrane protein YphA (DoxX/SURF4 family)